jgi:hypothetical protein
LEGSNFGVLNFSPGCPFGELLFFRRLAYNGQELEVRMLVIISDLHLTDGTFTVGGPIVGLTVMAPDTRNRKATAIL